MLILPEVCQRFPEGKPPLSHGFPMIFPFSYSFPTVFLHYQRLNLNFPSFSYGFPLVSLWFFHRYPSQVPFSCSSRIAATVTGMFDAVQGIGGALAWCNHPGPIQRSLTWGESRNPQENHRKTMENLGNYRKITIIYGKTQEIIGKLGEWRHLVGKTMGKPRKTIEKLENHRKTEEHIGTSPCLDGKNQEIVGKQKFLLGFICHLNGKTINKLANHMKAIGKIDGFHGRRPHVGR